VAANAKQTLNFRKVEFKLADTSAALHKAEMQCTSCTSELAQTSQALQEENRLIPELRSHIKDIQKQLEKAEQWNNIQVRNVALAMHPPQVSAE
jgi:vacuolar-type H+-ATPase subunit D/Vma8